MFQSMMKDEKQTVRKSSFWGIRCESGKKYSQIVNQKYHISMAALDPTSVKSGKEVVSLVVERDGSEFLLCNLQKDSVLQVNLNLFFDRGEKVVFSLKGQGIVHLTGYLIKDGNDQSDGPLQLKALNDSIALAKDKIKSSGGGNKNVQSKKNLSTQNDSWKVESKAEISTPAKKLFISSPKKSVKFQTNTGVLEGDDWNVEVYEGISSASPMKNNASPTKKSASPSPSQKTPQKKLFGTSKEESEESYEEDSGDDDVDDEDDDDEDEDDSDDDEEESDDNDDAQALLRFAQKRPISSLEEDDDDDDDEDDEDFEVDLSDESDESYELPVTKNKSKNVPSSKKLKAETSTPLPGKKSAMKNVAEVIEIDDDSKNGDMNSSIGRTPMPKKRPESFLQKSTLNDSGKVKPSKDDDSSDSDEEMETSTNKVNKTDTNKSVSQLNTSSEVPSSEKKKKKKKKKKKASADDSSIANQSSVSVNESFKAAGAGDLSKAQYSKKLPGGVEYEDIRVGNGPDARKGKLAHIYYVGKLANNKVFDTCQPGPNKKPYIFKLGTGSVIKGWDLAIEGMKVGGKRRIKVPPQMGFKNHQKDSIPPNSTLYFVVELKAVS